jgi:PTH2 family peptidyl-tRNA hydrolase
MSGKNYKQVIVVRKDLKLTRGKMSAQVSHASLGAYEIAMRKDQRESEKWLLSGGKKVVLYVMDEKELLSLYNKIPGKIPKILIRDSGLTHLTPGTITCFGVGPFDSAEIDRYTGHLKLVN